MPRRRASKGNTKSVRKSSSSVARWDKREEIPLDEVDQFHEQRDKILLEGDADEADDDFMDEDEVFALKGVDGDSEDEELDDDSEEDDGATDHPANKANKKSKKGKASRLAPAESSDESDEEEESWGNKKSAYYSSNAAQLEEEDEEAREMEEKEARRLQAKQRDCMREEDFGYNDALQRSLELKPTDDIWGTSPAPAVAQMDKKSTLKLLERTNPEALALAFDWDDVARYLIRIRGKLARSDGNLKGLGLIHVHLQTLQTYAALLAFYLHLRATPKYASHPDRLRSHPIMKRLVALKQGLQTFEEYGLQLSDSESDSDLDELESDELDESDDDESASSERPFISFKSLNGSKLGRLTASELADLLSLTSPSLDDMDSDEQLVSSKKQIKDTKDSNKPQKKRKKEKQPAPVVFDVEEPILPKAGSSKANESNGLGVRFSSFGEATALDDTDIADKGARKKALRFHTSKIESASSRRQNARTALGGDDDVPYRDRRKEKNSKIKKGLGQGGDDLDDEDPGSRTESKRRKQDDLDSEGSAEDDDGYYSLVKRQKKDKKVAKQVRYEEEKEASRMDIEDDDANGQRSISRAILKNKGLTPRRSKSVRNPRVKKRQKFEKAKKKLSSQKAIYKGGIGDANHYTGESSGISKVVKSVRM